MPHAGPPSNPMMADNSAIGELPALDYLEGMRCGDLPAGKDAEDLHTSSMVGDLRRLVEPADIQWLLPLTRGDDEKLAGLCISLLAAHSCRPEVQQFIRSEWGAATPYIRSVLLWRLIDDPTLPLEWHEKLFEFALEEAELFHNNSLRFFGRTEEMVIAFVLERLASELIPASKKWAYLCSVVGLKRYPGAARAIIEMGLRSESEFTARVASHLLNR